MPSRQRVVGFSPTCSAAAAASAFQTPTRPWLLALAARPSPVQHARVPWHGAGKPELERPRLPRSGPVHRAQFHHAGAVPEHTRVEGTREGSLQAGLGPPERRQCTLTNASAVASKAMTPSCCSCGKTSAKVAPIWFTRRKPCTAGVVGSISASSRSGGTRASCGQEKPLRKTIGIELNSNICIARSRSASIAPKAVPSAATVQLSSTSSVASATASPPRP